MGLCRFSAEHIRSKCHNPVGVGILHHNSFPGLARFAATLGCVAEPLRGTRRLLAYYVGDGDGLFFALALNFDRNLAQLLVHADDGGFDG